MIRRRANIDGLPFRVYERLGVRRWRWFYQPPDGPRVTLYECQASDVTKAEGRRRARIAFAERMGAVPEAQPNALTFERLTEQYMAWQRALPERDETRKAESTLAENERELRTLNKVFGAMLPDDILPADWYTYQDTRRLAGCGPKANKEIALASAVLEYGRRRGLVATNTARGIQRVPTAPLTRRVTLAEVDAVVEVARDIGPGATIQALAARAALLCLRRPPEILSLHSSQLTDSGIRFRAAKRKAGQVERWTTIEWSPRLRETVDAARAIKRRVDISGLVFGTLYGRQYTRSGWGAGWSDLMDACAKEIDGFERFTLQDCRAGGVTAKQERGDLDTLDATMHADARMVATIYDRRRERKAKPSG